MVDSTKNGRSAQGRVKSTNYNRLKFKSTGLECSDANKTPTTRVELKGKFSQPIETLQRLNQLAVL